MPRVRKVDPEEVVRLHGQGMNWAEIGRTLGCTAPYIKQIAIKRGLHAHYYGRPPKRIWRPGDLTKCHPLIRQALELAPPKTTQYELAERLGYSPSMICKIMNGARNLSVPVLYDFVTGLGLEIKVVPRSDTPSA